MNTIDSFYDQAKKIEDQKKEIEDFNNFTNNKVREIKNWYKNKKQDIKNKYTKKKEKIMSNYKKILGVKDDNFFDFNFFINCDKINDLEQKLDSEYNNFVKTIDKKRDKEVSRYRAQRDLEYEQLKKKHKKNL